MKTKERQTQVIFNSNSMTTISGSKQEENSLVQIPKRPQLDLFQLISMEEMDT